MKILSYWILMHTSTIDVIWQWRSLYCCLVQPSLLLFRVRCDLLRWTPCDKRINSLGMLQLSANRMGCRMWYLGVCELFIRIYCLLLDSQLQCMSCLARYNYCSFFRYCFWWLHFQISRKCVWIVYFHSTLHDLEETVSPRPNKPFDMM